VITRVVGLLTPGLWVIYALVASGTGHVAIALAVVTVLLATYAVATTSRPKLARVTANAGVDMRRGWTGGAANDHARGVIELVLLSKPRR
jgi:hypothetical protein